MADPEPPSYIDYESFLDPSFSAVSFANSLVLATNNPSDTPLDLTTPLSRVLFDVQEIDTHIHNLTTTSALPLLTYTSEDRDASQRIVKEIEAQVASLTEGYERLEKEVLLRWEAAEEVRLVTERLWRTVKIGRSTGRCLLLGRQLEVQIAEVGGLGAGGSGKKEDHRAMVRASNTLLNLRQIFSASGEGGEGEGLDKVNVLTTLKNDLINPSERDIRTKAQQIIREFSLSSLSITSGAATTTSTNSSSLQQQQTSAMATPSTYVQTEDTKSRTTSAFLTLYLLSSIPTAASSKDGSEPDAFQPDLLIAALQAYLQTSLTSSLAALARALGSLPTLDRALLEVSARCQNIVALEALLESTKPPPHPLLSPGSPNQRAPPPNLLAPLLRSLDTTSLPSHFWRSLASSLAPRVMDVLNKGGAAARTLRTNRDRIRDGIRECVVRGSQAPSGAAGGGGGGGAVARKDGAAAGWEREVGVMVGAVVGTIGR
ncbi:hypothetical protein FGG08_003473 [Glutinoglossum americanum]|uniref:Conserved oligomeric Golgi complex subunit 5 n=1 Tax=Glutinoglossum americanum TaxID=1670608 RepID=A0A9P8L0K9_9PEZI|nr:hypothetical protein FGG08_003473 [Glutinoglossum americanum]